MFRAIYADETPVGFIMLSVLPEKPEYVLWRFLIGEAHQGRGWGTAAMKLVIEHVRALGARELLLGYVPGEGERRRSTSGSASCRRAPSGRRTRS